MRAVTFTAPAAYAKVIAAQIAITLADIGRDTHRLARGQGTSVWHPLVDRAETGRVVITITELPSEEQQLRDQYWPDEPPVAERFAGFEQAHIEAERKSA